MATTTFSGPIKAGKNKSVKAVLLMLAFVEMAQTAAWTQATS